MGGWGRQRSKILIMVPNVFFCRFNRLGLVADPIIEAIARLEFEDSLKTGGLSVGYLAQDQFQPLGGAGCS